MTKQHEVRQTAAGGGDERSSAAISGRPLAVASSITAVPSARSAYSPLTGRPSGPDTTPTRPSGGGYASGSTAISGFSLSHISGPGCPRTDESTPAAWLRFADLPGTATAPNPVDKWLTCPGSVAGQGCGFPTTAAGYAALPTVTFVHGNQYQSMHDGNISEGDTWVKNTLGGYAQWASTHNSDLIVTWDEDDFTTANHSPLVFYGANVKPGSYSETVNHYNVLRTVEDMYGPPYLTSNDSSATPITDTWGATTFGAQSGPGPVTGYDNWCLDNKGSVTTNLNPVDLYPCTGNGNQSWTAPGDGTLQVQDRCLDVLHSGTTDGTTVDIYSCNGGGAQQWVAQANGTLLNPQSGKCLDDPGSSLSSPQLIIWDCAASANQLWHLPS